MRNKEEIQEVLDYFQAIEKKTLDYDEEAIVAAYHIIEDNQSLAIKILSVFGGILASLAFIGFLFIAGLSNTPIGMSIFGVLSITGAIFINMKYNKIVIDTGSVSIFIIGFLLLGFGLSQLRVSENILSLIFIIIALSTLCIVQNYILSFISLLIISGSILALILSNNAFDLIHVYVSSLALILTYVFLKEAKLLKASRALSKLYDPIRIGLIFSFFAGLFFLSKKGILPVSPDIIWLSSIVIIGMIFYLVSILFNILGIAKVQNKFIVYIFCILILIPTAFSPAISGAILIILLSFWTNYKTGLVLSIIAFIYFLSQYYYDLNFTLLTKSMLLFSSGLLFILFYLITQKKMTTNEKV